MYPLITVLFMGYGLMLIIGLVHAAKELVGPRVPLTPPEADSSTDRDAELLAPPTSGATGALREPRLKRSLPKG
jgi:hypothetical protein